MKNIKRKTMMLLLAFCITSVMVVVPMQTDFTPTDEGFFTKSVEARLVNGEMFTESRFDGPDQSTPLAVADFTPSEGFVLSDGSDYDEDQEGPGLSGTFLVTITGYWRTGQDYYWKEVHYSTFSLNPGHTYDNLKVRHWSEDYDNTVYTTGTGYYWYSVNQFAATRMELDIYFYGWHIGKVTVSIMIWPTSH